jgi:hypothetical protein
LKSWAISRTRRWKLFTEKRNTRSAASSGRRGSERWTWERKVDARELADEELSRLLVATNLTESDSSRAVLDRGRRKSAKGRRTEETGQGSRMNEGGRMRDARGEAS